MPRLSFIKIIHVLEKLAGILVGILGVCILFRKLFFVSPEQTLWADNFDSKLMYWIVNWGYHILFEAKDPLNFWNANSFFPESQTLAYSDSILSIQLLFSPLRAMGITPFAALYLSLAGFTILGCFFTGQALRRLKIFSTLEIAIIVFGTHFSLSFISFLNHYQLFGFHLAPGFFLYLYLFLKDFKRADWIITCGLFSLGAGFATYLAPIEVSLAMVMVVPSFLFLWRENGIKGILRKFGWSGAAIGIVFAVSLYFIQLKPYLSKLDSVVPVNFNDYVIYSASPLSIFKNKSIFSFWYGAANYSVNGQWEYAYFPGYILLVLGFCFIIYFLGSNLLRLFQMIRSKKMEAIASISQSSRFILYIFIFFLCTWIFSVGPYVRTIDLPNPLYWFFVKVVPGMANIRAPGRLGIWLGFPLSIFLVFLIRYLKLGRVKNQVVLLILLVGLVVESLPDHSNYPFALDPRGIYQKTAQRIEAGTPLIELPITGNDIYATLGNVQQQLDGSTLHWARLVVGYGAKTSPGYDEIVSVDADIQRTGEIQPMLDFARQNDIFHFLVYLPGYPEKTRLQWQKLFAEPSTHPLLDESGYLLFQMDAQ